MFTFIPTQLQCDPIALTYAKCKSAPAYFMRGCNKWKYFNIYLEYEMLHEIP